MAAVLALASVVGAFYLSLPTARELKALEMRLNLGDADGHATPYTADVEFSQPYRGLTRFAFRMDLAHGLISWMMGNISLTADANNNLEYQQKNGTAWVYRDYSTDTLFDRIQGHSGYHVKRGKDNLYSGSMQGGGIFTLQVDEMNRFESLQVRGSSIGDIVVHYHYVPDAAVKVPGSPQRHPVEVAVRPVHGSCSFICSSTIIPGLVVLEMQHAVRAEELELFLYSTNGSLLQHSGLDEPGIDPSYSFAWEDRNLNGFVDNGDFIRYNSTLSFSRVDVYDSWAQATAASFTRRESGALEIATALAALVASVVCARRLAVTR